MDIYVKAAYSAEMQPVGALNVHFALFPEEHYGYDSECMQTIRDLVSAGF